MTLSEKQHLLGFKKPVAWIPNLCRFNAVEINTGSNSTLRLPLNLVVAGIQFAIHQLRNALAEEVEDFDLHVTASRESEADY